MPIELHPRDPLIDTLVADLKPVALRPWQRDAALLALIALVEVVIFTAWRSLRPDLADLMMAPVILWKMLTPAAVTVLAFAALLLSLDPSNGRSPALARLWKALAVLLPVALAFGWLIDAGTASATPLLSRLYVRDGLDCLLFVSLLSLPPTLLMGRAMQHGAPVRPKRAALAAGLAGAGIGAMVFAAYCRHDDPIYVVTWYGGAMAIVALVSRLVLPRLARW